MQPGYIIPRPLTAFAQPPLLSPEAEAYVRKHLAAPPALLLFET